MTEPGYRRLIEVVGTTGVVLSLLFVGLELRHANRLAEADAVLKINELVNDINLTVLQDASTISSVLGTTELVPLQKAERIQLFTYYAAWMNVYEAAWKQHERGIIQDAEFDAYMIGACNEFTENPHARQIWANASDAFAAAFVTALESRCPGLSGLSAQRIGPQSPTP